MTDKTYSGANVQGRSKVTSNNILAVCVIERSGYRCERAGAWHFGADEGVKTGE